MLQVSEAGLTLLLNPSLARAKDELLDAIRVQGGWPVIRNEALHLAVEDRVPLLEYGLRSPGWKFNSIKFCSTTLAQK